MAEDEIKAKHKNDKYLIHPKDSRFYNIYAYILYAVGMNSQEWHWYTRKHPLIIRINRAVIIWLEPVATWSQIVFTYQNYMNYTFSQLTVMLTIIPVCCTIMVKVYIAQSPSYKKAMRDYMRDIHLYHYYKAHPDDEYAKQILIDVEKYFRISIWNLGITSYLCTASWIVIPIRHNLKNNPDLFNITVPLEVCTYMYTPFDYEYNIRNYVLMQIISTFCSFSGITVMYAFDALALSCIYHLIGHMKILTHKLEKRFRDDMSDKELKALLVDVSNHYRFCKESLATFEGAFGFNIAFIYIQNLFEGGVLLFQTTTGDLNFETIMTYGLMIPYLQGLLVVLSFICEYMRTLGDNFSTLVYKLDWSKMSLSNQKLLLVIMAQLQYLFEFKASFNIKTGVQPGINIIKTTFSYYVMIKSRQ